MASSVQQMAAIIIERSKTLINNDLKKILKEEGTSQTGNKAALQARVIGLITHAVQRNDADSLRRLQYRVQHHGDAPPTATSTVAAPVPPLPPPTANGYTMAGGYQANPALPSYPSHQPQVPTRPSYLFKDSPFYEIRELILGNIPLEASPTHRQNSSRNITPSDAVCNRMKSDPSLRLLLFSTIDQPLSAFTRVDITFPSQIEVRIGGEEVKANYKGLKNKPGSTRPVDITSFVRTTPANHRNPLIVTYALTQKASPDQKYILSVYLAKKFSVEDLARRIKQRNVITKQSVLNEMMKKANDPDIEVGSSVMSLKDPISTLRMKTPCRSTLCTHNQCFDAESFLQLQEQAPTWTCPICNKTISYEGLAVDQYVEEILNKARNADQVTIEPNGEWLTDKDPSPKRNGYGAHDDDSDDDLIEIPDYRIRAIKSEHAPTPTSINTPPSASREASTAPRSGNKRPSEVVDLTLSDDDEPPRPAKKVAYSTPNSLPDISRRYQLPPLGNPSSTSQRHQLPSSTFRNSLSTRPEYSQPAPPPHYTSYQTIIRPPPPASRQSYPGQGTSAYPTYLGSSP